MNDLTELNKKLDALVDVQRLQQALSQAAIVVENNAKMHCPVDTGTLRRSITHEVEGLTARVGTNEEYGPYVEFGTGLFASAGNGRKERWSYQTADGQWHSTIGQKPQPFLNPALQESIPTIKQILGDALRGVTYAEPTQNDS